MLIKSEHIQTRSVVPSKLMNRVPEITFFFWLIKMMATTVGETAADFLSFNLRMGLTNTTYVMAALLIIALIIQFKLRRYVPAIYWLVVVLISIVGTLITDNLVDNLHVSLLTTMLVFAAALTAVFILWYKIEKTLSMHTINNVKRELFYWVAVLFTFALGTSTGDLVAEYYHMGYAFSALIFMLAILVLTLSYYRFRMNEVLAFWMIYILTRPLGASIGDMLAQPTKLGGLGFGTLHTSAVFFSLIVMMIAYLTVHQDKRLTK